MRRAIVLLSGGIDSTTTLAIAKADGYAPYALTLQYGQRHAHELNAARDVAHHLGVVEHAVVEFDLRRFGGSALTADIEVPKDRPDEELRRGVPITYVPARNTIFLSFALGWAEVVGARDIFIGANVLDASGYPDCRPQFLASFERMARLATKAGTEDGAELHVRAPLLALTKADIVRRGLELGVDYGLTWSCYDPVPSTDAPDKPRACGRCDTCQLRLHGFEALGMRDPIEYAQRPQP